MPFRSCRPRLPLNAADTHDYMSLRKKISRGEKRNGKKSGLEGRLRSRGSMSLRRSDAEFLRRDIPRRRRDDVGAREGCADGDGDDDDDDDDDDGDGDNETRRFSLVYNNKCR